jgi:hypothetical protein
MLHRATSTRRRRYSQRLHNLAERIRGHEPERHQPVWVERHDPREVAAFLAAFRDKEKR